MSNKEYEEKIKVLEDKILKLERSEAIRNDVARFSVGETFNFYSFHKAFGDTFQNMREIKKWKEVVKVVKVSTYFGTLEQIKRECEILGSSSDFDVMINYCQSNRYESKNKNHLVYIYELYSITNNRVLHATQNTILNDINTFKSYSKRFASKPI